MIEILLPAILAGYVTGVVLTAAGTFWHSRPANIGATVVFILSWVMHSVTIVKIGVDSGYIPLTDAFEYLLMFGWAVSGLYLFIAFRHRVAVSGLVLPPLAALATAGALSVSKPPAAGGNGPGNWFLFHTTISTLGMAILGVAFGMAVLYLVQDHALKSRNAPGLFQRLPSLQKCDHVGLQALIVGFILLTVGIGTGIVINSDLHSELLSGGPKQIFPLLAWGVFLAVLLGRTWLGYRGRKSALLTIAGFILGVAGVLGMTL